MQYAVAGIQAATAYLDVGGLPVLVIGYSRGGALAVEYGAVAARNGLPVPDKIMSIFPASVGNEQHLIDLTSLDHSTGLLIQMGEEDAIVGRTGARHLLWRLRAGGFPAQNIKLDFVKSHAGFTADHFAPLQTSPSARAAFWRPADLLLVGLNR